jgi:replication factor C small subunit
MLKPVWAIKYRPTSIADYIFQNESQREIISKFVAEKSIPNLLLSGHHGAGKTTLALILRNEVGVDESDFLQINASDENSVETIRSKIKSFVSTMCVGPFKLVLLDEADYISGSAQAALRGLMEDPNISANARFILTCNFPNKIMAPIRSRCQEFEFNKLDRDQMMEKAAITLMQEGVEVDSIEILESYVDASYPDFRKMLIMLEQNSVNGKLRAEPLTSEVGMDYKIQLIEMLDARNWQAMRSVVCNNVDDEEWVEVYQFLYGYIHELKRYSDATKLKQAILIIADHLYKHGSVADPEINFTACCIRLCDV